MPHKVGQSRSTSEHGTCTLAAHLGEPAWRRFSGGLDTEGALGSGSACDSSPVAVGGLQAS